MAQTDTEWERARERGGLDTEEQTGKERRVAVSVLSLRRHVQFSSVVALP